ncbi:hypothetical protein [Pseudomonas trivialis]|uniref:DUF8038 domain-containing protein n=1 Tax=Pseudomonas trivialis TaxID=200450 RepID=A0A0R2ZHA8_9PSED|nr:hypothetical protein [Pseudomonas trivialis]KRP56446.1 hypothetical protein TU79_23725 [Pseudomonas trivialis]SDS84047.1 hypothetical protein SAMN04490205_3820 [Pseudomonas trivialis]
MQGLSNHNPAFNQSLPALPPACGQPFSRQQRDAQAPVKPGTSRTDGDRLLALQYRNALLEAAQTSSTPTIHHVPPHSTFGQWWGQLRDAFQSTDMRQWIQDRGINRTSITLDPQTGEIAFMVKGKQHKAGQDDAHWRAVSGPVLEVARLLGIGTAFAPPATLADEPVPWWIVGRFYQEPQALEPLQKQQRALEIERDQNFKPLDPNTRQALITARSEDALDEQKTVLADIHTRHAAAASLQHLANTLQKGIDYDGQIEDELKKPIHLSEHASYYPDRTGKTNQVSLLKLLKDHGWDIPTNHEQLENLATALATPVLTSPIHGNLGGALAWPEPLAQDRQRQLTQVIHSARLSTVRVFHDDSVLTHLLRDRPVSPQPLRDPRRLIDDLLRSPKGKALAEALQAFFERLAIKGSPSDWLLAALNLESSTDIEGVTIHSPQPHIEGFPLVTAQNAGKTPSIIVKELAEYLLANGNAESAETATIRAHLQLANRAPQFLVNDIPKQVKVGAHSWVSFTTAVARLEAKAPGATAGMSYAQVMLHASAAPLNDHERQIEYAAQQNAIKDWAVANGLGYPMTEGALTQACNAFNTQIRELREAAETQIPHMPTTSAIALEQLKKALPDMNPKLLEAKCIELEPSNKDFPGPYSILDLFIDGRFLRRAPDGNLTDGLYWLKFIPISIALTLGDDVTPGTWNASSKEIDIKAVLAKIKDLPSPRQPFETAFTDYANAVKRTTAAQIKTLVSNLPLEDRQNLEFGKITVRTEIDYWRNDHPLPVEKGTLLVETVRNGTSVTYAINRLKGTITKRPEMAYKERQPTNGWHPSKGKRYDVITPGGEYPSRLTDEKKGEHGTPYSYASDRTRYLAEAVIADMELPAVKRYAKGATTFETQVPTYRIIEEIALNLIPFRSAIKHFIDGKTLEGFVDLAFDIFGFAVGLGAAFKGAKALSAGASALSRIAHAGKILGRAAVGALNPLSGLDDLARGAINLARRGVSRAEKLLAALAKVDVAALAKKPNIAQGTLKGVNGASDVGALAKLDEATGQWHAINPVNRKSFGQPLSNFQAKVLSSGELSGNMKTLYKKLDKNTQLDICYATALRAAQADKKITDTAFNKIIPEVLNGGSQTYNRMMKIRPDTLKSSFNAADISESGVATFVSRRGYNKDKIVHAAYIQKAPDGQLHLYHSNSLALDHALGGTRLQPATVGKANVYTLGREQQAGIQRFMDDGGGYDMVFTPSSTLESSIRRHAA